MRTSSLACLLVLAICPAASAQGDILVLRWSQGAMLVDSTTGAFTPLPGTAYYGFNCLAYHPVNGLFYTLQSSFVPGVPSVLHTIDPATGTPTSTGVGVTPPDYDVPGLAITQDGTCYALNGTGVDSLYRIDLTTGARTFVGSTGLTALQSLAADPAGNLWAWKVNTTVWSSGWLVRIDPITAQGTIVGIGAAQVQALTFSPSGVLYGGRDTIYTIDTATGAATPIPGPQGLLGDVRGMEFTTAPVTFVPADGHVAPGGTLTINYYSPARAGESFAPVPSCTWGSYLAPPLTQPLPIAWDFATDFYFNDPVAIGLMPLSGVPGSFWGTLDATGRATGFAFPPASLPPGVNIRVHVTFVSWNASYQTTVHGAGTFWVN
jgi:hypothetical protein